MVNQLAIAGHSDSDIAGHSNSDIQRLGGGHVDVVSPALSIIRPPFRFAETLPFTAVMKSETEALATI